MRLRPFCYSKPPPVPEEPDDGTSRAEFASDLLEAMYRRGRAEERALVHVPYTVEQDQGGAWRASATLRPGVAASGEGPTMRAAVDDLAGALQSLIEETGRPDVITVRLRDIEKQENDLMPSKRFCRAAGFFFAALAILLAFVWTPAHAATAAPRGSVPSAAVPMKPGPRGEFTDGHIAIRGLVRGHNYCISTEAHPGEGSFVYMAPCEPRDPNEWFHCVKYYSFGACTSAANPRLDLGQAGRSAFARMVRPDHAGKNWILQFFPLSGGRQQVSVIRLPGFHGLYLSYPYTPHRVNPVFWGSGRLRGWGNEFIIGNGWHTDP